MILKDGILLGQEDFELGKEILENLQSLPNGSFQTFLDGTTYFVAAFDEPIVAKQIKVRDCHVGLLEGPYDFRTSFRFESLTLDEWDRFHGYTECGIPFVLSSEAQNSFFDQMDSFDDESIVVRKKKYPTPPYWPSTASVENSNYWSEIYVNEVTPGWDLGKETPLLAKQFHSLRLPKSRIIVLGCGEGHDAAFFAKSGHLVTAVDFSEVALTRARERYPPSRFANINWYQFDAFHLPENFRNSFDLVFEHTCFCAINPSRRNQLVRVWKSLLHDQGHFMGVLFAMEKRKGPPFGSTEWEIRQRLKGSFQTLLWERSRESVSSRLGREVFIYAKKAPVSQIY